MNELFVADQAAMQYRGADGLSSPVISCPHAKERQRIRVRVVGEDGQGLQDIAVVLTKAAAGELRTMTAPDGWCEFEGLDPGSYQLSLRQLDQDAWEIIRTHPLTEASSIFQEDASWQPVLHAKPDAPVTHGVAQGECIAKISERYGISPLTVWNHDLNAGLRRSRESMHILAPGDTIIIPAKRPKNISIDSGTDALIKRLGVPQTLNIRFLDCDGAPRAGLKFIASLYLLKGQPASIVSGRTDSRGFLNAFIPPASTVAEIELIEKGCVATYQINIGHLDPLDSVSGWQSRLNNLGYGCGMVDGFLGPRTIDAIRDFQRAKEIAADGLINPATKKALLASFLS